mmetsp:Transcript_58802/g.140006  ORF Transcript_58802/g.140006 Transcript_58802/m.140006 type:complete len:304 (+) Transcript_58802:211-1122(+)
MLAPLPETAFEVWSIAWSIDLRFGVLAHHPLHQQPVQQARQLLLLEASSVGAHLQEKVANFLLPFLCSCQQRCDLVEVPSIDLCAEFEQRLSHLQVPVPRRHVQRRLLPGLPGVGVRARPQQLLRVRRRHGARGGRGHVEGRAAEGVGGFPDRSEVRGLRLAVLSLLQQSEVYAGQHCQSRQDQQQHLEQVVVGDRRNRCLWLCGPGMQNFAALLQKQLRGRLAQLRHEAFGQGPCCRALLMKESVRSGELGHGQQGDKAGEDQCHAIYVSKERLEPARRNEVLRGCSSPKAGSWLNYEGRAR